MLPVHALMMPSLLKKHSIIGVAATTKSWMPKFMNKFVNLTWENILKADLQ